MLTQIIARLFQTKPGVEDFVDGTFPAAPGVRGLIQPLMTGFSPRVGSPLTPVLTGSYLLTFSTSEGTLRRVISEEVREKVLVDLRRQELEEGRVYRFPDLGTLLNER